MSSFLDWKELDNGEKGDMISGAVGSIAGAYGSFGGMFKEAGQGTQNMMDEKGVITNELTPGTNVMSGASAGASMGKAFGPWGAAIGGVAGGITGLVAHMKEKRNMPTFADQKKQIGRHEQGQATQSILSEDAFAKQQPVMAKNGLKVSGKKLVEAEADEMVLRKAGRAYRKVADFRGGKPHEMGGEKYVASQGDIIIPSDKRNKAESLLKYKRYNALNQLVQTLPEDTNKRVMKEGTRYIQTYEDGVNGIETDPPTFVRRLKKGYSGEDVAKLQKLLTNLGLIDSRGFDPRGMFGRHTQEAVDQLEKITGHSFGGSIGPKDMAILGGMETTGGIDSTDIKSMFDELKGREDFYEDTENTAGVYDISDVDNLWDADPGKVNTIQNALKKMKVLEKNIPGETTPAMLNAIGDLFDKAGIEYNHNALRLGDVSPEQLKYLSKVVTETSTEPRANSVDKVVKSIDNQEKASQVEAESGSPVYPDGLEDPYRGEAPPQAAKDTTQTAPVVEQEVSKQEAKQPEVKANDSIGAAEVDKLMGNLLGNLTKQVEEKKAEAPPTKAEQDALYKRLIAGNPNFKEEESPLAETESVQTPTVDKAEAKKDIPEADKKELAKIKQEIKKKGLTPELTKKMNDILLKTDPDLAKNLEAYRIKHANRFKVGPSIDRPDLPVVTQESLDAATKATQEYEDIPVAVRYFMETTGLSEKDSVRGMLTKGARRNGEVATDPIPEQEPVVEEEAKPQGKRAPSKRKEIKFKPSDATSAAAIALETEGGPTPETEGATINRNEDSLSVTPTENPGSNFEPKEGFLKRNAGLFSDIGSAIGDYAPAFYNISKGLEAPDRVDRQTIQPVMNRYQDNSQATRNMVDSAFAASLGNARNLSGGSAGSFRSNAERAWADRLARTAQIGQTETNRADQIAQSNIGAINQARQYNSQVHQQADIMDMQAAAATDSFLAQGMQDVANIGAVRTKDANARRAQEIGLKSMETNNFMIDPKDYGTLYKKYNETINKKKD